MRNIDKGKIGEEKAKAYLVKDGYKFVESNYKVKGSEIDLIFIEPVKQQIKELDKDILEGKINKDLRSGLIKNMQNILVFVEVKSRSSKRFGEPFEAVNYFKQKHIQRGAEQFKREYNLDNVMTRFDIVSIVGENIEHIKDVF